MKKETIQKIGIAAIAAVVVVALTAGSRRNRGSDHWRDHRAQRDSAQHIEWVSRHLNLSKEQRETVEPSMKRLMALRGEGHTIGEGAEFGLGSIWTVQSFNRERAAEAADVALEDMKELSEKIFDEIESIHGALNEDQRRELGFWIEKHDGPRKGQRR